MNSNHTTQADTLQEQASPLIGLYTSHIESGLLEPNPTQQEIIESLSTFQEAIVTHLRESGGSFLARVFGKVSPPPKGVYLHGGVGCGKTTLMDMFFQTLETENKQRVHFHAFMQEVHATIHAWRQGNEAQDNNAIEVAAEHILSNGKVICFDEFQVYDITDAMILARLFEKLFKRGAIVVATSNVAPEHLYRDGLQRERFEPFIDILLKHTQSRHVDITTDYRLRHVHQLKTTYFTPLGNEADAFMKASFAELTQHAKPEPRQFMLGSRTVEFRHTAHDAGWVGFNTLCEEAYGSADYIDIAREFSVLLLDGIPRLTPELRNETKRFILLVDSLYEYQVTLICSAQAAPENLCDPKNTHAFEFERTASRLIEMQSDYFLGLPHKG